MKNIVVAIVVLAVIALAGAAGYFYYQNKQIREQTREQLEAERAALQDQAADLEKKIVQLETRLREDVEAPPPAEDVLREAIEPDSATRELPATVRAETLQDRVFNFFSYLDSKGYAARRGFDISSQELCMTALQKLAASRPLISGENQDLFALMRNMTFLFRALGKDTLLTARDIVHNENAIMEPAMALFYEWLNPWQPQPSAPEVSREMMYDYAGFFLQSMGGRAYLFRRDPGVRMLTLYYSILVLDQANRDGLNSEGIDIVPALDALIQEMRYSRRLSERHRYLEDLREIRSRY
jgi:type II secretory pathway pseudopilin PulG